ncbi:MAG: efflux RND transporter periplasmic adaptor subunit [Planctomycetota bacterium]|nr:efflux RND transporter periplasmic adaptor subunit [Planctomycetota bacterium]MDA1178989.1 efflux RND transporter periplasmic adaptor subunit [Planctomycetota bacterium]
MSTQTDRARDALASLKIDRRHEKSDAPDRGGRIRSWLRTVCVAILAIVLLYLLGRQTGLLDSLAKFSKLPALMYPPLEVEVTEVIVESGSSADAVVVATGYLESRRQAKIGARIPGRIEVIHVEEGSRVTRDQILASLEHADLDAALSAARATLAISKSQLVEHQISVANFEREAKRAEKLWQSKSFTDAEYDKAKYQFESALAKSDSLQASIELAVAKVQEAEQLRANVFVRAPFDGTVISKDAEVGESILPGGMGEASGRGSVVTIADLNHLEVDSDVKEDYIGRIHEGQLATVAVDAVPDRTYQGRVRKIIPMGDRARATIKVKIEVLDADSRLFPDMSGTVRFLGEAEPDAADHRKSRRIFCPRSAIQTDAAASDLSFVWIVSSNQKAHRVTISTGTSRDQLIEVTTGLSGGEQIIVDPSSNLKEDQSIKPVLKSL